MAYNPEYHKRVKHIERRHFFVRECVENFQLVVPYVNTHANDADFFTKPLSSKIFYDMRDRIMNVSPADGARAESACEGALSGGDTLPRRGDTEVCPRSVCSR